MRKIAVFFGGKSNENEISILTGVFVLNLIDREKFLPIPVYIHSDGEMYTSPKMFDLNVFKKGEFSTFVRIFFDGGSMYEFNAVKTKVKNRGRLDGALNCCHGGLGEGGGVSALMQMNGIPLASPPLAASGMFMDKALTKIVAKALNIPTVEYIRVSESDYSRRGRFLLKNIQSKLKYPVVVKPANLGSSIGVTLAENEDEAAKAIETAFLLDNLVLLERYVKGKKDVNCGAYSLGGEIFVSEPEEASAEDKIYSFSDKYIKNTRKGGGMYKTISDSVAEKIRLYTKTLYKRMNLKGIIRVDYLVADENVYLCEVNTVPGSLAYYLFCERISDAKNLFSDLLDDAIRNAGEENKYVIPTGILQTVSLSGKSRGVRL